MPSLDVRAINPFLTAAQTLFATMAKIDVVLARPRLRRPGEDLARAFEISARIDLVGPTEGVIAVALSSDVACALASALCGYNVRNLNDDCRDALGEIANMLVGQAKTGLPGGTSRMSVPVIVPTADVVFPDDNAVILIPFDTHRGRFVIAVGCRSDAPVPTDAAA